MFFFFQIILLDISDEAAPKRRRESGSFLFFNKRRSTESAGQMYRESLSRFTKFRENERKMKVSMNPYENTHIDRTSIEVLSNDQKPKCPEKPKRLSLQNSKQSRKVLSEAHFSGAYQNFEIQSPFFSNGSSSDARKSIRKSSRKSSQKSIHGKHSEPLVVVNKYGEEVEYAMPYVDLPVYQRGQKLPNCFTSDDPILEGEIFNGNLEECERILDENFEINSNVSASMVRHGDADYRDRQYGGRITITDLDKSIDSLNVLNNPNTFIVHKNVCVNEVDSTSIQEEFNVHYRDHQGSGQEIITDLDETNGFTIADTHNGVNEADSTPNRVERFQGAMKRAGINVCSNSDFNLVGNPKNALKMPFYFGRAIFRRTNVTVRKYDDAENCNYVFHTAMIQDAEVLR